jgi:hypothetical protein
VATDILANAVLDWLTQHRPRLARTGAVPQAQAVQNGYARLSTFWYELSFIHFLCVTFLGSFRHNSQNEQQRSRPSFAGTNI